MRESRLQTQGAWASRSRPADSERLRSLASPLCFCTFRLAAGSRAAGCVASLLMISDPVSCVNSYCLLHVMRQRILRQLILPTHMSCVNSCCLLHVVRQRIVPQLRLPTLVSCVNSYCLLHVVRQRILPQLILPTHVSCVNSYCLHMFLASTHVACCISCVNSYCLHMCVHRLMSYTCVYIDSCPTHVSTSTHVAYTHH